MTDYQGGWLPTKTVQPQLVLLPRARTSDSVTAHLAAEKVRPGNSELVKTIRAAAFYLGAATAFEIADEVEKRKPGRWASDSIRTACARAGLITFPGGETPRGNACNLYSLQADPVAAHGRV